MGNPAHIRPATEGDLQRILEIYNDAILTGVATWEEEPWPMERRLAWWKEHDGDPSMPVLVAEHGGRVEGFSYLSLYRPKSGYRFTREDTVYIEPAFQGRGIGRALVERLIGVARATGMHALMAVIEASNEASIALHRGLGFELAGLQRETGFKFGRWLDAVTMELLLEGG